jgi:hypothetical protein
MKKAVFLILAVMRLVLVQGEGFENYISTSGDRLMDGNKVFRFISVNVPTLNYQEDVMDFTQTFLRGDDWDYDDPEWDSLIFEGGRWGL